GGAVLKGPTAAFMAALGQPANARGIAALYEGVIDSLVADEPGADLAIDTHMSDATARRRIAAQVLEYCEGLA
ncbi:MAG TPA: 2-phospho-L-lactate transferase, partial [Solirubrobacteraceae bacterium]|nr:2-phospho-L-lactate transferase [Solirubrobacteraceae bacterium]